MASTKKFDEIINRIQKEQFTHDYCKELLSTTKMCEKYDVCLSTLNKLIAHFELTRDFHAAKSKSNSEVKNRAFEALKERISKEELYQYYIEENHGYYETVEHFELKPNTFDRLLHFYDIKQDRSRSFQKGLALRKERYGDDVMNTKKREQTILEKYGTKENFYAVREEHTKETNKAKYGYDYMLQNPAYLAQRLHKVSGNSEYTSSLEKRFEEFLKNNKILYSSQYAITKENLSHAFDFAIYDTDKNLKILVDCDGVFYHAYTADENGKTASEEINADQYRSTLVPENVIFLTCAENSEEECYKSILSLINISYDEYVEKLFQECRKNGFPYDPYNEKIVSNSMKTLSKYEPEKFTPASKPGMKIIYNYHPSIWKCNKKGKLSPYDAWENDDILRAAIKNRIIYKGCSLYPAKVLAGFSVTGIAPKISIFNPYLAKYIGWKYLNKYDTVFDPCSGYSGRLLGITSLGKKYIGQDINQLTVGESNKIISDFNLNAEIKCKDLLIDSGKYDCLFTCPPYSDKETWGEEIQIKSCDEWINSILRNYDCELYIFVVDKTKQYKEFIKEEIVNKSHFRKVSEYIIVIKKEDLK